MTFVWMMIGGTIALAIYALVLVNRDREEEEMLRNKINQLKEELEKDQKGIDLMLRLKDEEISRLKEMLKGAEK